MPNTTVWAAAEGMPKINRRSFFCATAAASIIAPAVSASSSTVEALIFAHEAALSDSDAAWSRASQIDEGMGHRTRPKVQVGQIYRGMDDAGDHVRTPLFAYSEEEINERVSRDMMAGPLPSLHPDRAGWTAKAEARRERLLAEFRVQEAAYKAAEMAAGLTAAENAARAKSAVVDTCLEALLAYPYATIEELRTVLGHLIRCWNRGAEGVDGEETFAVLAKRLVGVLS